MPRSSLAEAASGGLVYPDGLPAPRRYWSIATILLAIGMSVLDSSIVNVALPTLAREFRVTATASIWVINAYNLAILVAILPLSSLGEIVGYRRVSQCGLAVFTLASLGCSFCTSLTTLSLARVAQGLGAAGIMSVNGALVRYTYPQRSLGLAVGINAFAVAVCSTVGPTIAAAILAVGRWQYLFAINVPIGVVAIVVGTLVLPHSARTDRPLNLVGALLNVCCFGLLVSGLQSLAHDAAAPLGGAEILLSGVFGVLLVRHEIGRGAPLLPFDLLRIRIFSLSLATSVVSFMTQMIALVALPFEIQRLGHSAVATGLLMTPWPAAVAAAAPLSGRLADRYPAAILGGCGLTLLAIGLALIALLPADASASDLAWRMALCGVGFGFFQSPNNRALLSAAPRTRSGAAGGMLSMARLFGKTLGAAGVAILFRAFGAGGSHLAVCGAAGVALAAAAISFCRLEPDRR